MNEFEVFFFWFPSAEKYFCTFLITKYHLIRLRFNKGNIQWSIIQDGVDLFILFIPIIMLTTLQDSFEI